MKGSFLKNSEKRGRERKMKITKKKIRFFLALIYITGFYLLAVQQTVQAAEYWPEGPQIGSESGIVMDIQTGTILYEKNIDHQHYPASITKIMTALLAVENSKMDEVVTFSKDAVYKTEGSGIARDVGEEMTMEQCLYGMMLESSNECAYAIAEHVGGTLDKFVQMMNEKAKKLGCTNTHFNNPHGLPDENHYTSAHDMARIARAAYQNETFRLICGTKTYTIPKTNKHKDEETYLQNHHNMLFAHTTPDFLYEYCTGGKTGYTSVARYTLVTFAEKDGMSLVSVIMKNDDGRGQYEDTRSLLDFAFDNFQMVNVAQHEGHGDGGTEKTQGILGGTKNFAQIDPKAEIILPKTAEFSEAAEKINYKNASDHMIATIRYQFAGHDVGKAKIIVSDKQTDTFPFTAHIRNGKTDQGNGRQVIEINIWKLVRVILVIVVFLLILLIWIHISGNMNFIKHKIKRKRNAGRSKIRVKRSGRRWKK